MPLLHRSSRNVLSTQRNTAKLLSMMELDAKVTRAQLMQLLRWALQTIGTPVSGGFLSP